MKDLICTIAGIFGSAVSMLFGGWDVSLGALLGFMIADYITGLIVAGVFKKSPKTANGALESNAGMKGLLKKCVILVFVYVAHELDLVLQVNYIKTAVVIGFMTNELISLIENAGLMGIPLPKVFNKAIEVLTEKGEN
ncbi:hypothetical protein P261_02284 [Lachnospiraceae bacterium TWA4]|nr:hypothetical protein P261_02284 [Lachnospiraceae bacterium TWA4]